ncbi:MAG: hypothetical protein NC924_00380, partial [Candidatus Omnitrophica bacterium]|nr:hypothetical protein [Candidatus Omnitrophota bacterium]
LSHVQRRRQRHQGKPLSRTVAKKTPPLKNYIVSGISLDNLGTLALGSYRKYIGWFGNATVELKVLEGEPRFARFIADAQGLPLVQQNGKAVVVDLRGDIQQQLQEQVPHLVGIQQIRQFQAAVESLLRMVALSPVGRTKQNVRYKRLSDVWPRLTAAAATLPLPVLEAQHFKELRESCTRLEQATRAFVGGASVRATARHGLLGEIRLFAVERQRFYQRQQAYCLTKQFFDRRFREACVSLKGKSGFTREKYVQGMMQEILYLRDLVIAMYDPGVFGRFTQFVTSLETTTISNWIQKTGEDERWARLSAAGLSDWVVSLQPPSLRHPLYAYLDENITNVLRQQNGSIPKAKNDQRMPRCPLKPDDQRALVAIFNETGTHPFTAAQHEVLQQYGFSEDFPATQFPAAAVPLSPRSTITGNKTFLSAI